MERGREGSGRRRRRPPTNRDRQASGRSTLTSSRYQPGLPGPPAGSESAKGLPGRGAAGLCSVAAQGAAAPGKDEARPAAGCTPAPLPSRPLPRKSSTRPHHTTHTHTGCLPTESRSPAPRAPRDTARLCASAIRRFCDSALVTATDFDSRRRSLRPSMRIQTAALKRRARRASRVYIILI